MFIKDNHILSIVIVDKLFTQITRKNFFFKKNIIYTKRKIELKNIQQYPTRYI